MKLIIAAFIVVGSAHAQIPSLPKIDLKVVTEKVMSACKEDKKNIKGCDSYTEFAPLKECLLKNKDALSQKCKDALSFK